MNQRYVIPSLDRAIQVLGMLAGEGRGMTLADLGRRSGIPKSTLFRILSTLQLHHLVQWNEDERCFRLGYYLWELGRGFIDQSQPYRVAERHMKHLSDATGETVFLSRLEGNIMVYVRRVDGTKAVAMMRNLGQSTPVYCTASGRAFIAALPKEEADAVLDTQKYISHTDKTITDRAALEKSLAEIRRLGCAVVDAEYNRELLCISAPVYDHESRPCAVLTLAMLSAQGKQPGLVDDYVTLVKEAACEFSRDLGFLGGTFNRHSGPGPT